MFFAFYSVTSIREITYIFTVVCVNTIITWLFCTTYKQSPVRIVCFVLTTLKNEQHPYKCVRVDEYGALEKSIDVTNLLVDDFRISMENTGGDASWIKVNN